MVRTVRRQSRHGLILLIVLGMLSLFSLLAVTYVVFSGQSRSSSVAIAQAGYRGTPPEQLSDLVVRQLVRGTTDRQSSLYGQDLLQDIYGEQVFIQNPQTINESWANIVILASREPAVYLPNAAGGQPSGLVRIPLDGSLLRTGVGNAPAAQLAAPQLRDDYFTGRTVTFLDGPVAGQTFRVIRYVGANLPPVQPNPAAFEFSIYIDLNEAKHYQDAGKDGATGGGMAGVGAPIGPGVSMMVNSHAYRGVGRGVGFDQATGTYVHVRTPLASDPSRGIPIGLLGNPGRFPSWTAGQAYAAGAVVGFGPFLFICEQAHTSSDATAPNLVLNTPTWARLQGSTGDGYDAPDYNNYYLSFRRPELFGGTPPTPPSLAIIPSFHRPAVINYLYQQIIGPSGSPSPAAIQDFMLAVERATGRPLAYDYAGGSRNRFFTGSSPSFPIFNGANLPQFVTRLINGPWDVDTDGDGIEDSIWIDPNLPVITQRDGKLVKVLAAMQVVDMDGRINLNAAGDRLQGHPAFNLVPQLTGEPSLPPNTQGLIKGLGYGPAELHLGPVLGNNAALFNGLLNQRYGRDDYPGRAYPPLGGDPRIPDGRDISSIRFREKRFEHLPDRLPGMPVDIHGRMVAASDLLGNLRVFTSPIADGAGVRMDAQYGNVDPYRSTGGAVVAQEDELFTLVELETLLRELNTDASMLPQRLRRTLELQGVADVIRRQLLTTRSVDLNLPQLANPNPDLAFGIGTTQAADTVLRPDNMLLAMRDSIARNWELPEITIDQIERLFPPEFRLGAKFDVNMPFGSGRDMNDNGEYDEPAEINQALASGTMSEPYPGPTGMLQNVAPSRPHRDNSRLSLLGLEQEFDADQMADPNYSPLVARNLYARYLYCIAQALVPLDYQFPGTEGLTPDPNTRAMYRARKLAQWAVNVVDFRDADAAMTRFEYDPNPFDGQWQPQPGCVVWGLEFPELVFSESLALHDVRVKDTFLDASGKTIRDPQQPDMSLDQYRLPEGSLFLELFCPRTTGAAPEEMSGGFAQGAPTSLYTADPNVPGRMLLDLQRMAPAGPNGIPSMPVWRIAIGPALRDFNLADQLAAEQDVPVLTGLDAQVGDLPQFPPEDQTTDPRTLLEYQISINGATSGLFFDARDAIAGTPSPLRIDRMIWFGTDRNAVNALTPQAIPEMLPPAGGMPVASRVFYNRNNARFVEGGGYLVIGPRPVTFLGQEEFQFPVIPPLTERATFTPSPQAIQILPNLVRTFGFGDQNVDPLDFSRPDLYSTTLNVNGTVPMRVTGMVAAADLPPNMPRGRLWQAAYPNGVGVNVSMPNLDQLDGIYEAPVFRLNSEEGSGFDTLPPDSYHDTARRRGTLPKPFDVNNPVLLVDEQAFGTADFPATTIPYARTAFLQRLADPLRPYDPVYNPYITTDWMPIDLSVFNGEDGRSSNAPAGLALSTRQRSGEDARPQADTLPPSTLLSFKWQPLTPLSAPNQTGRRYYVPWLLGGDDPGVNPAYPGATLGFWNKWEINGQPPQLRTTMQLPGAADIRSPLRPFLGTPIDPTGSTPGLAGLTWFNRQFASAFELMMVPSSGPGQLHQEFTPSQLVAGNPQGGLYGLAKTPPTAETPSLHFPFGHLPNFFAQGVPAPSGTPVQNRPDRGAPELYRLFEWLDTPSRFAGVQRFHHPGAFETDPGLRVYRAPYNRLDTYREPGKVNLNTVNHPLVMAGVEGGASIGGGSSAFGQLMQSRQGYQPQPTPPANHPFLHPESPSQFIGAFRNPKTVGISPIANWSQGPTAAQRLQGTNLTLLRRAEPIGLPGQDAPVGLGGALFQTDDAASADDPWTMYQPLMRLPNLVTQRSNVFAVWVTLGYFEYDPSYGLGEEYVGIQGAPKRHRAFYIIDRSIPVGYETGRDHNTQNTILLRRFVE